MSLDVDFLRAIVLMDGFKGQPLRRAQACLLRIALRHGRVMGSDIPAEITNGSLHMAGAACGGLLAQNLLIAIGREKSPIKAAHGRKLNVFTIPEGRAGAAEAWFRANGFTEPQKAVTQMELPAQ